MKATHYRQETFCPECVAAGLVGRFDIRGLARHRKAKHGVETPAATPKRKIRNPYANR